MTTASRHAGFKRVLVGTDFSENASAALQWAALIANAHGASLTVLHVAHATTLSSLPLEIQQQIDRNLSEIERQFADGPLDVTTQSTCGKPWDALVETSRDHDLVVVGARGQTPHALHVLGIGSTADRVLRGSPVPVLTIHADDQVPDTLPRHALVPIDFSETSSRALHAALALLRPGGTESVEVTLVHAWQPLVEYDDVHAPVIPPDPCADSEEQAHQLLEAMAADHRAPTIDIASVLRAGYPAKVIEDEAASLKPDLIAIGTHGHSGLDRLLLGSIAERVVHRTRSPILSLGPAPHDDRRRSEAPPSTLA